MWTYVCIWGAYMGCICGDGDVVVEEQELRWSCATHAVSLFSLCATNTRTCACGGGVRCGAGGCAARKSIIINCSVALPLSFPIPADASVAALEPAAGGVAAAGGGVAAGGDTCAARACCRFCSSCCITPGAAAGGVGEVLRMCAAGGVRRGDLVGGDLVGGDTLSAT